MSTNDQLTDAIRAVLNNPNESLCYCDEGWAAVPIEEARQRWDKFVLISDHEDMFSGHDADTEDIVYSHANRCQIKLRLWLRSELIDEVDQDEPLWDRVKMLKRLMLKGAIK